MVEAAGVEPASEGTSSKESTCVSASGFSCPTGGSGQEPPGTRPGKSHDQAPSRHLIASRFNGVLVPTTRRGRGGRSQRFRLRERTEYPQLTDVPSDLRVNGARHASRDSMPPSKPNSPPQGRNRCRRAQLSPTFQLYGMNGASAAFSDRHAETFGLPVNFSGTPARMTSTCSPGRPVRCSPSVVWQLPSPQSSREVRLP
jgi:hypothetical protein